jgi:hypothetical protein
LAFGECAPCTPASASGPVVLDHVQGPDTADTASAAELATSTSAISTAVVCCALGPRVCSMSRAKKARLTTEVATGPPALSWEHRSGHLATRLGRSGLWCLRCHRKPVGPYQAWPKETCFDEQPISAMPVALASALLRAGPLAADAAEGLRIWHGLLLAAARVVPVAAAAFAQASRQEEGRLQEH